MTHTNTHISSRFIAALLSAAFISNILAPTLQYTFAASTQYYVDATLGSDANDGLSPATPWQTLSYVNSQIFSQGDTISFLCGESWTWALDSIESGIIGTPITYNAYGTGCTTINRPQFENIAFSGSAYVNLDGVNVVSSSGNAIQVENSTDIHVTNSQISLSGSLSLPVISLVGWSDIQVIGNTISAGGITSNLGLAYSGTTNVLVDGNNFTGDPGIAIDIIGNGAGTIQNNTIRGSNYGIKMQWTWNNLIQNNIFPSSGYTRVYAAIALSPNTTIQNNQFLSSTTTPCAILTSPCGTIENNSAVFSSGTIYNATIVGNYIEYENGHGVSLSWANDINITSNTIKGRGVSILKQFDGIHILDGSNIAINSNTLLLATKNSVSVVQNTPWAVNNVTMNNNTLFQRNNDHPYIEMRDDTTYTGVSTLITANGNNFVTLYRPDTSYVRSVKFGGETIEYATKSSLNLFDATNTRFQSFGYKPYTNTGTYATANLLVNPSFETDVTGWTPSAAIGLSPVPSHNVSGSYSGSSMIITPQDVSPDHIRVTNDAILSITVGQVYEVSGFLRSTATGQLNIRGYLHKAWDMSTVYSDRIAETYSTATGRAFSYYIYAASTAVDAQFTLEMTNQDISLEIDELSLRRKTIVTKNTNVNEVLMFSNTGNTVINQGCPGGVPCAQYVDTTNTNIGWPGSSLSIPGYASRLALWNNSSNLLTVPAVTMNIDSGSIPSGTLAHITWMISSSDTSTIQYTSSTGTFTKSISNTGELYFEPPAWATTSTYIFTENSVGPRTNQVDVTTTNTPPIVYPVTITGIEDSPQIDGTLSGIDQNPGDSVFFDKFTDPTFGSISVDISGTASYIPNPDFCGTDTFLYRAYDQYSNFADPVTATLQITCVNDTPTAVNDSVTVTGSLTTMNALANDTDPDSIYEVQTFFLTGFTQPSHGSIVINANKFDYAVDVGYIGPDSFTYSMMDQSGAVSNTGIVSITVSVPNTPPTDAPASYTGTEDANIIGTLSGSDINPDTLSFSVSTMPVNGTVNIVGSTFTYIPTPNFFGTDSFVYRVFDGSAYSSGALISLSLSWVPDAPVAVNDSYSLVQDTTFFVPVMNNDSDIDSATGLLSLTGNTNPTFGTLTPTATGYIYTATWGYVGPDSFTYRLIDETSLFSNVATVNLTITSSNTAPIVSNSSYSLNEDTVFTGTLSGSDLEQSTLTYIVDTLPTSGTVSLNGTGGFSYTPNPNYYGTDSFTFHANDGLVNSNIATISIMVNAVNDIPVASSSGYTIAWNNFASSGNVFIGALSATDIEDTLLSYTASTLPMNGVLVLANSGTFTYTPAYGYTGSDSFTFHAIDSSLAVSNTGTITFMITGINSAPLAFSGTYMTNEDTPISFSLSGSDPDGSMVTYIQNSSPANGTLLLTATGYVLFTPATDWNGTTNFTFRTSDGLLTSAPATITIDVLPVNDAPIAASGALSMSGNTLTQSGRMITFTGSATDVDSSTFTFTASTLPTNGTLTMNGSGGFIYRPNIWYVGIDSFWYRANDGVLQSIPAQVSITVIDPTAPIIPVVIPIINQWTNSGPGGGGGGGGGSSASTIGSDGSPVFSSAPEQEGKKYSNINGVLFATNDPTGLAGQLLLMNRVLGKIGVSTSTLSPNIFSTSNQVLAMVQQLITDGKSIDDNATYLRRVVRVASILASISTDPIKSLDDSIAQIRTINTQKNTRLTSTQQYAIRVLNFRKKLYEEMINRDLKSAHLAQSTSKTSKKIDTNPSLDTTGDADLDAFLQLLASQG